MHSGQNDSENANFPEWIERSLFEPVLKDTVPEFKQIKDFKVNRVLGAGENYNTIVLRLIIAVELNDGSSKSLSFMLKTAIETEMYRMMSKLNNVFENETIMYKKSIPEFDHIYKEAGIDIEFGPKFYPLTINSPNILLEDLHRRGFKNANRIEGLNMEHAKAALKKLAQWHAVSAVRVSLKGLYEENLLYGPYREEMRAMMKTMFAGMTPLFLKVTEQFKSDEEYYEALCKAYENMIDEIVNISKINVNEFNVLNHGDCWSNNIMFQYDAFGKIKETYFIDFQMPKYGSPAQDLYYFILSSTKYEIKVKQFDYFIKYYHEQLSKNLQLLNYSKTLPSLRDIHIMMFKYNAWGFITVNTTMAGALLEANDDASAENFLANTEAGIQFKIKLASNPRYRQHMKIVLPWMYNRSAF